jgi:hypothetical protein
LDRWFGDEEPPYYSCRGPSSVSFFFFSFSFFFLIRYFPHLHFQCYPKSPPSPHPHPSTHPLPLFGPGIPLYWDDTVNKTKRPPTDWERIFTYPKSDRGLMSNIYKEPSPVSSKSQAGSQPLTTQAPRKKTPSSGL